MNIGNHVLEHRVAKTGSWQTTDYAGINHKRIFGLDRIFHMENDKPVYTMWMLIMGKHLFTLERR